MSRLTRREMTGMAGVAAMALLITWIGSGAGKRNSVSDIPVPEAAIVFSADSAAAEGGDSLAVELREKRRSDKKSDKKKAAKKNSKQRNKNRETGSPAKNGRDGNASAGGKSRSALDSPVKRYGEKE